MDTGSARLDAAAKRILPSLEAEEGSGMNGANLSHVWDDLLV